MKPKHILFASLVHFLFACNAMEGSSDKLPLQVDLDATTIGEKSIAFFEEELNDNAPLSFVLRRARLYYENQQYGEALEDIYRILNEDSENPSTHTLKALVHYQLGSLGEAAKSADLAESLGDQSKDLFYIKTLLLAEKGKTEEASIYMGNALALAPYSGEIWWANGKLNFAKGDSNQAVKSFAKAVSFDPEATYIYEDLIEAYRGSGKVDSALVFVERAINNIESNQKFKLQKASILEQVGNLDSALVVYQDIYKGDPSRLEVLTQIGNLYFKKKRYGNAFANYSAVLDKLPTNANMQYLAGLCQERMGYYGTAQTFYIKARTNQPENEVYNKAFERARFLEERKVRHQVLATEIVPEKPVEVKRRRFSIDAIDSKKKVIID